MGQEYDDLNTFRTKAKKDLAAINSCLQSLYDRVDEISIVLDEIINYSYFFNLKFIGLPELNPDSKETAKDTTNLVVKIFNKMGADVTLKDIDIVHRVPSRSKDSSQPKPIICKFVRRLAKEEVMSRRKEISRVDAAEVGLSGSADLGNAALLDHLPPKTQILLHSYTKLRNSKPGLAMRSAGQKTLPFIFDMTRMVESLK